MRHLMIRSHLISEKYHHYNGELSSILHQDITSVIELIVITVSQALTLG